MSQQKPVSCAGRTHQWQPLARPQSDALLTLAQVDGAMAASVVLLHTNTPIAHGKFLPNNKAFQTDIPGGKSLVCSWLTQMDGTARDKHHSHLSALSAWQALSDLMSLHGDASMRRRLAPKIPAMARETKSTENEVRMLLMYRG